MMRFLAALSSLALLASAAIADDGAQPAESATLYLSQADAALREGRLTQAAQMLAWLEQNPTDVIADDLALLKAELAIARDDADSAAISLRAVRSDDRNICRLETARGWVAGRSDALDSAIVSFGKATEHCPDDAGAWNLLGLALIRKGETEAGKEAFAQALILAPDSADIINNHALALVQKGELQLAIRQLAVAAAMAPSNQMILANRDFILGMTGELPVRRPTEGDAQWSRRLISFGKGAKAADHMPQANALFSQALLTLDRFEPDLWSQLSGKREGIR
jgi:Flp pilus assembly protein TadD